jgi:allantoate deiminase
MTRLDMTVSVDAAGNLRGRYRGSSPAAPTLFIGSHLDTVPNAGAFDGILGVALAIALVDLLRGRRFPFAIEVVGFSEEEGVRFGVPFIGSRALAGTLDATLLARADAHGTNVADAIRQYGLDPRDVPAAAVSGDAVGFVEFHIEQGPVLDALDLPLGVVDVVVGSSRFDVVFTGVGNHAGTTPMSARRDALTGAAEWILAVETLARATPGLVATVGEIAAHPGAVNVIAGACRASLDVRHADDALREAAVHMLLEQAREIAGGRGLRVDVEPRLNQRSTKMDPALVALLASAVAHCHQHVHRLPSGAGHDAMIMAGRMPAAMLFVRSPGGVSHHPDEDVQVDDVGAALIVGHRFLDELERSRAWSI